MSWESRPIGELVDNGLADIQTGPFGTQLKARDYVSGGTPVINVRNIGYGDLRAEDLEFVTEETADRLSAHRLRDGDIVFGRKGAVDRHLFVTKDHESWLQGSDCIRLRFSTTDICSRFVSYSFLRTQHQGWMLAQSGNKATMASLNQDIIKRIILNLPPPETQGQIVSILSAYDDLIENNRRRMALLEKAARLLYEEWFVRLGFPGCEGSKTTSSPLGRIPATWQVSTLGDVTTKIGSGATPRGGEASYQSSGIALIRSQNVYDNHFEEEGLAYINEAQADELANVFVQPRDILLNITGASVARCCMVPKRHLPARVNQHVMIIRIDPSLANPYFILAAVNSDGYKRQLLSYARAGGTREALTKDMVSDFQIMLPTNDLLEHFGDIVGAMHEQSEILSSQNAALRNARDLLLPRLMSGEIPV